MTVYAGSRDYLGTPQSPQKTGLARKNPTQKTQKPKHEKTHLKVGFMGFIFFFLDFSL